MPTSSVAPKAALQELTQIASTDPLCCVSHLLPCTVSHRSHFFLKNYLFIYLFIFGCVGSLFLCKGFLQLRQAGATLHHGVQASHHQGLSCCGAQTPDAQAQQQWLMGLVAPWHVGSSQTRARTRVPCIGRQILNHCATREAPSSHFLKTRQLRFKTKNFCKLRSN